LRHRLACLPRIVHNLTLRSRVQEGFTVDRDCIFGHVQFRVENNVASGYIKSVRTWNRDLSIAILPEGLEVPILVTSALSFTLAITSASGA
jgi:hypothetical protein